MAFTYVASHDLQEPLRKIQTFAGRILEKEKENLSDVGKFQFGQMIHAARRMEKLIADLLAFSRLNTTERKFENTNLRLIVEEVKNEFKETIHEKHATIIITNMCEANVIPFQFRQLMQNLIGNSLKFSHPEKPLRIIIKSRISEGKKLDNEQLSPEKNYCHISVTDNGIGFGPQYKHQIFEVFKRLHSKDEYQGTGEWIRDNCVPFSPYLRLRAGPFLYTSAKSMQNRHGIIFADEELSGICIHAGAL